MITYDMDTLGNKIAYCVGKLGSAERANEEKQLYEDGYNCSSRIESQDDMYTESFWYKKISQ